MLFVHQVHRARQGAFENLAEGVRQELIPAVAAESNDARVLWCGRSLDITVRQDELITLIGVRNAEALGSLGERFQSGDLAVTGQSLATMRAGIETRFLKSLVFNPFRLDDLNDVPLTPSDPATSIYMHDFVTPRIGARRSYEEGMRQVYASMNEDDLASVMLWISLEPLPGGGPFPEQVNISRILDLDAMVALLEHDVSKDNPTITEWMRKALKMRDTWLTRLVRSVPWSPLS